MIKRTIGEIFLEKGIITQEQYEQAQAEALAKGVRVEQILLEKKYITQEQLAQVYADYASLDYVESITDAMADVTALGKIPLKFLRDNVVMPITYKGSLAIACANPMNFQALDELNLLLNAQGRYVVASEKVIIEAINRYYPLEGAGQMIAQLEQEEEPDINESVDFSNIDEKDILSMASEAPIIKLVNHIFFQAVKRGASDIHIEPFEKEILVRYRIDGVMYSAMTPPKRVQGALASRIKIMANLNIAEKRIPQDGRIEIKIAGKAIDIRVSVLPVTFGERIVMRLLDKSRSFKHLKDLGFAERDLKIMEESIKKPNGIIYITGPTGSGKTSTLYSILGELNTPEVNIITVEDPVEYQMAGIGQVQVKDKIGLTFAAALRSILRQDPDIIMIGETRDQETAQIAIQSALTGHLVFSTLHTNSAPATLTRLLDMGIEPYLLASSIIMALAQRLVRKLCPNCKKAYTPTPAQLESINLKPSDATGITFYEPVGCDECNKTGYKGRLAVFEVMLMTPAIAQLTMQRADTGQMRGQAIADGMTGLLEDGVRKIKEGLTTIDEVLSVASSEAQAIEV